MNFIIRSRGFQLTYRLLYTFSKQAVRSENIRLRTVEVESDRRWTKRPNNTFTTGKYHCYLRFVYTCSPDGEPTARVFRLVSMCAYVTIESVDRFNGPPAYRSHWLSN